MPFDIKFHEIPEKIRDVEHHIRKIGQVIEQGKKRGQVRYRLNVTQLQMPQCG